MRNVLCLLGFHKITSVSITGIIDFNVHTIGGEILSQSRKSLLKYSKCCRCNAEKIEIDGYGNFDVEWVYQKYPLYLEYLRNRWHPRVNYQEIT